MAYRLAVFDMAGTTVADDNAVGIAFQQAFRNNGYEIMLHDINPLMGYHKPLAIQMVLEKLGEEFDEDIVTTIHEDFVDEMINYYEYDPDVKPLPAAEELFLELKEKGIKVALNTGFPHEIAETILKRFQWRERGLVDDFIASDEVERGRPYPFMIHELMNRAGVDNPSLVVKVGDTEVDVNEGRNSKCGLVVAVTTGAFTREQLEPYKPDHIVDNLSELIKLF
jgi:phosphonatase-like hydrolase